MNDYKLLLTFSQLHEAHLAKGYLNSERIAVFLKDEYMSQIHNFAANASGGVSMYVSESDYNRSIELLKKGGFIVSKNKQRKDEIIEISNEYSADQTTCPFCHSDNFTITKEPNFAMVLNLIMLLFASVLPIVIPIYKKYYLCFDCGKKWKIIKK